VEAGSPGLPGLPGFTSSSVAGMGCLLASLSDACLLATQEAPAGGSQPTCVSAKHALLPRLHTPSELPDCMMSTLCVQATIITLTHHLHCMAAALVVCRLSIITCLGSLTQQIPASYPVCRLLPWLSHLGIC